MQYRITHRTLYLHSQPVSINHSLAMLTPLNMPGQTCLSHAIFIDPPPDTFAPHEDFFGNTVTFFSLQRPYTQLSVTGQSDVEILARPFPDAASTPLWREAAAQLQAHDTPEFIEPYQFTFESPGIPRNAVVADYAEPSFASDTPILQAALHLLDRIHADFQYVPQSTTITTPLEEVLQNRCGVCQDFSHLVIGCLRSVGLAARYVSGYLRTLPPPGQPALFGVDDSHAWVELFIPGYGWIGLDPTNNMLSATDHITLACGRDYHDVCPLRGVVTGGGEQTLQVSVDVTPLDPQ